MTRALACGVFALSSALTGCGTVQNFARPGEGEPRPLKVYGATARSYDALKGTVTDADALAMSCSSPFAFAAAGAQVLDVSLSVVVDTITLPITLFVTLNRLSDSEPPASPEERQYWQRFWGIEESRPLPVEPKP